MSFALGRKMRSEKHLDQEVTIEPDYLQERIAYNSANTPGFAEAWEPMALALELAEAQQREGFLSKPLPMRCISIAREWQN